MPAITRDFFVKSGLTVQGTADVTTATGSSSTLQVNGGASIAKSLIVGGSTTVYGNQTVYGGLSVDKGTTLAALTASGIVSITNNTAATQAGAGALTVAGGVYVGNNLVINSANGSTSTSATNALYVQGGAWIEKSLNVGGPTIFRDTVVFSGTATYVYSTNTYYTDNIINLHVPPGGVDADWTFDDGKDIGFKFHYYNGTDTNGALVLANDTKMLEWYSSGAEGTSTFVGAAYGGIKAGFLQLTSSTAASSTITGALQVAGGVGIGGAIYAGGNVSGGSLTARNLSSGKIVVTTTGGELTTDDGLDYVPAANLLVTTVTNAITATNIAGGVVGQILYQRGTGLTGFMNMGSSGNLLQSNGSSATFVSTSSINVGYATTAGITALTQNLQGGSTGAIVYQSNTSTTAFLTIGTAGYILASDGTNPYWGPLSGVTAGEATTASNLKFGFQNAIPYQTGAGATAFEQEFQYDYTNNTFRTVNAVFTGTTVASGTNSGALQVVGGVGIGGNLHVGGTLNVTGRTTLADVTGATGTFTNITVSNRLTGGDLFVVDSTSTTLNVTGRSTLADVTGASGTFTTFNVTGQSTIQNETVTSLTATTFNVTGQATVQNATVTSLTATILTVTGRTTLADVTGATGTFTNITVSNRLTGGDLFVAVTTATRLNVTGQSSLAAVSGTTGTFTTFVVTGQSTIQNETVTSLTATTFNVTGQSTIQNQTVTSLTATILTVTGRTTLADVTGATGTFTNVTISNRLTGGDLFVAVTTATRLNVTGQSTLAAVSGTTGTFTTLVVTGQSTLQNATVTSLTATTLTVTGRSTLADLTGNTGTFSNVVVTVDATVNGILRAAGTGNASNTTTGALRVTGGAGIGQDLVVGGTITAGANSASAGNVVNGLFSNNVLLASYTSPAITSATLQNLDAFSTSTYRTARYTVQIVDGGNVHVSEIVAFHTGGNVYLSEYGILTNNGQLGTFDASIVSGNLTLQFTPTAPSSMTIKVVRFSITS